MLLLLCGSAFRLHAQPNVDIPVAFAGEVRAVEGSQIVVNLLSVDISRAQVNLEIASGALVTVVGVLRADGVIQARVVTAYVLPTAVPTAAPPTPAETPLPTPVPDAAPTNATVLLIGPIQAVNPSSIVIYSIEIVIDPTLAGLPPLRVGQTVRVEAERVDGVIVARSVSLHPAP
jgi:hypothetical protein